MPNNQDVRTHVDTSVADSPLLRTSTAPLLQYGGKEAALILAVAVLILAIAQLIKVLVPVMIRK